MPLAYDLHIHSCLSPCADRDMTPGSICAMARLNGLGLIAVTDHQSAENLPAAAKCALRENLMFLPGIEVCTKEEVHILCYFDTVDAALCMGKYCQNHLPDISNRPQYFGEQIMMNDQDQIIGYEDKLLLMALDQSLQEVCDRVRQLGGLPVPAHINRGGNGLLTALGMIPEEENFTALEITESLPCPPLLRPYHILHSSDAHTLGDIARQKHLLYGINSPGDFIEYLSQKKNVSGGKS